MASRQKANSTTHDQQQGTARAAEFRSDEQVAELLNDWFDAYWQAAGGAALPVPSYYVHVGDSSLLNLQIHEWQNDSQGNQSYKKQSQSLQNTQRALRATYAYARLRVAGGAASSCGHCIEKGKPGRPPPVKMVRRLRSCYTCCDCLATMRRRMACTCCVNSAC